MKKLHYLSLFVLLLSILSCQSEEITPMSESVEIQGSASEINAALQTNCDISGLSALEPNMTYTFTYTSDFNTNYVTWSIESGNISIVSGQGSSTVTISTHSDYAGASLKAIGSGDEICSDTKILTVAGCTAPTSVTINKFGRSCDSPDDTFTATVSGGSTNDGTYSWTVSNGAIIGSGQGTNSIYAYHPNGNLFMVSLTFTSDCENTVYELTTFPRPPKICDMY